MKEKNILMKIPWGKIEEEPESVIDNNSPTLSITTITTALPVHGLPPDSSMLSPDYSMLSPVPSPANTRSGKAKKDEERQATFLSRRCKRTRKEIAFISRRVLRR